MLRVQTALILLLAAAPAWAQETTPRVMVIFDTSGSMLWNHLSQGNCEGDGSVDFPHNALCADTGSRMSNAKEALSTIVQESHAVEFGLMRYGQLEPGDPGFGSPAQTDPNRSAQYYVDGRVVATNYDGMTNGCGPADVLVEPGAASRDEVLGWMDGREDYPADKELRANGFTPLTHSLQTAQEEVIRLVDADPEAACRPYYVLLLTDGYQQCPGQDAGDPAVRAGVRDDLVRLTTELRALPTQAGRRDVRTFVVGFGPGATFSTELDEVARAGGTAVDAAGRSDLMNGTAYQANDPHALVEVLRAAVNEARPRELCNGMDDDCDRLIDEDFPNLGAPCEVGRGACAEQGVVVCADDGNGTVCDARPGDSRPEICNGLDDDCDGQADEGLVNRCGDCGPEPVEICNGVDDDCDGEVDEGLLNDCGGCGPVPVEVCNGVDDDCDGAVDEGVQNACGECGDVPSEICNCADDDCDNLIDENDPNCPPCDCTPSAEICDGRDNDCDQQIDEGTLNACGECGPVPAETCNGLDDDCDGQIDEDFPEAGQPCGSGVGACQPGTQACVDGRLTCQGGQPPTDELCDNVDNDCDGEVDDGARNACRYCGPARVEVCDNIDNDCDGVTDRGEMCRNAVDVCVNGECAPPCENGECFNDRVCVRGQCVAPCRNIDCPDGWACQDGECTDPCVDIQCDGGDYCTLGKCVPADCYGPAGCPQGQICQGAICVNDPCAGANCPAGQGCVGGECFADCSTLRCPDGEVCINGACQVDACARVTCPYPQICEGGTCVEDPCFEMECQLGFICEGGACVEDPCQAVTCPSGATCHRGRCGGGDGTGGGGVPPSDGGVEPTVTGSSPAGDDCSCRAGEPHGPSAPWALLMGALALLGLRRRR